MSAAAAPLRFNNLAWLLGGLALAAAPHAERLPIWITSITLTLLGWRAWLSWKGEPLPRKWLLIPFVGACLLGVYISFNTIFGRDAGVGLLIVFLGLKLMEMKSYRDVYVVMFLAYFIALTNFFYSQSIPTASLMMLTVLMITASLVSFQAPSRRHIDNLKSGAMLLAQAAPLMLLLFFLFPRVQGPLWGLPQDAYSGITGLSDSMTPGNISQLSQSDAVAFRAKFDGPMPPRRQLYWRGPVFWNYDGRTWRPGDTLEITLERQLEVVELPGDPERVALRYGAIVLAARLGREGLDAAHLRAPPTQPRMVPEYPLEAVAVPTMSPDIRSPAQWLEPIPGKPLAFRARRQPELEFAPLYRIQDERFAVYLPVADAEFD
jgi:hypothetical protein